MTEEYTITVNVRKFDSGNQEVIWDVGELDLEKDSNKHAAVAAVKQVLEELGNE